MHKAGIFLGLFVVAILGASIAGAVSPGRPEARVHFFDVGQGDAALIDAGRGVQVLIDGGPDRAVLRGLGKAMPVFDRRIELVILSHPHLDHYGGLIDTVTRYEVGAVMVNQSGEGRPYERLIGNAKQESRIVPAAGQRIPLPGGTIEILEPKASDSKRYSNPNDASVVVRLELHGHTFLFPGDAEEAEERRLLGDPRLDAEVLKVPHHGSSTSSTDEFLASVTPNWCVISSGKGNRYGHPDPETVSRLASYGCRVVRTDQHGTIMVSVTEAAIRFSTDR